MKKYLIEVPDKQTGKCFIDNVVLEGDKEELMLKLQNIDYAISLGIHEDFWFLPYRLVLKDDIDFSNYRI